MTYQIPNIFGNDDGTVPATQLDQNFQYLLNLIEAGNTVISILHSQVSDWTPAVQLVIQQYLTSSDGTVNISSRNGLLNLQAVPSNASVQAIVASYLSNTDGSLTITNSGGQLVFKVPTPTITHSNVSDWTSSVQETIAAYLESTDGSVTITNNAGFLDLSAKLASGFTHTNITDWTSAVQTSIGGYLYSSDSSILISPSGGRLNLTAATPTITHANVSDFTSAVETVIGSYLTPGNSSISMSISNGQLNISSVQQSITHSTVSDWTSAVENTIGAYLTNTDGTVTITNTGGQLNIKATAPTITHTQVSDWTPALQSGVLGYLTSDGSITFSQTGGQLSLRAVTPTITSSGVSNFTTAVQDVINAYLENNDGTVAITQTNGLLNIRALTPALTHANLSDWTTAVQATVAAYIQSANGTVLINQAGGYLTLSAPTPTITHLNVSDWSSAVQNVVASYVQAGDGSINVDTTGSLLKLTVPPPIITHSNVSDWTPSVQNTVLSYLSSTDGSITITNNGGSLNLKAVSPTIPHNQVSDWSSAVQSVVQSYLINTDNTINITPSGGFLNISAAPQTIAHNSITDWTTAVDNAISSYLTNTDGSITLTNTGTNLNIKANIPAPSAFQHTAITDWNSAVQAVIATYLESSDNSITITQSGGFLNLRAVVPSNLTHSNITDWTAAIESTVGGYLINTDGTIHLTNTGSNLVISATQTAVQIPHTSVTDWTSAVQSTIASYLTSANSSITITNTNGGLLNLQAVQQTLPHTNISDWTSAVQSTVAGYLTSTNGTVSITNTGTSLNFSASPPTNLNTSNISNFTSGVESVIASYLESTDNSIVIAIDNTNNKLNLTSGVSGVGPGSISHTAISDWTSAVQTTVSGYLFSQNNSITFTTVNGQLSLQVGAAGGFPSSEPHTYISDWTSAVQATVAAYVTSSNGSIGISTTGGVLNFTLPGTFSHTNISDWTSAVQSTVAGYLTTAPGSFLSITNTGSSLQLGNGSLTHNNVSDWSTAVFNSVATDITSSSNTISINTSSGTINLGMIAQPHTWITDWSAAVLASVESILVSSNGSITISPSGSQVNLQVAGGGSGSGAAITTSPATLTIVSGSPAGTQIAALSTTGFAGPFTYSIVNPSGRYAISGANLVAGNTATDYTQTPTDSVTIQSTNGTNTVSDTFSVTVTAPSGASAPIYDMNFVTGVYNGSTVASGLSVTQANTTTAPDHTGAVHTFAANTPRITDLGLFITPGSVVFAGHYDTTPNNWGYTPYTVGPVNNYNTLVSKTVQPVNGIFTPVTFVFSDNTGSRLVPGITYADCPQGTNVTVTARVQPSSAGNEGLRIAFECLTGSGATSNQSSIILWHNLKNGTTPFYNPGNLSVTVTQPITGVFEIVIYGPVPGDGTTPNNFTVSIAPNTGGDGSSTSNPFTNTTGGQNATMTIWGMSTAVGKYGANYGQTAASAVTVSGDVVNLQNALATPLSGTAGTILIELGPISYTPAGVSNAAVLSANGGATDVLSVSAWTSISNNNGAQSVPVGMGGMAGISRIAFAHDNTGYSMCVNGGVVGQYATVLTLSGTQQLLKTLNGSVRRITGWNYRLTNTNLQAQTQIFNQSFVNDGSAGGPNIGQALNVNNTAPTFFDDFLNINTVRTWAPGTTTSSFNPTTGPLEPTISETTSGGIYGPTGNWLPRFPYDGRYAAGCQGSNPGSEYQWYVDPNYPWATGFVSPFSQSGSSLTITLRQTTSLSSGVQAQFANYSIVEQMPASVTGTAQTYPWASGVLTSEGVMQQAQGYFEMRGQVPVVHATWPAWWIYAVQSGGPHLEIDIMEAFGTTVSDQAHLNTAYNSALHAPGNNATIYDIAQQAPADKSTHFYTYGCLWRAGSIQFYLNGALQYYINYTNGTCLPPANGGFIQSSGTFPITNLDNQPMYMIINLANGNNGSSVPDGTENGAQYTIDYVGVWS